ncbi:MAG TPA: protein tyrosine phosphatase family protein [Sphingobium sp.]
MTDNARIDPTAIALWRRFNDRLTTSAQPTEDQLGLIAGLGVAHLINLGLHSHEKALPNEAYTVAGHGMDYIHIPVLFDAPTEADYAHFRDVMRDLGDRTNHSAVHVHCIANFRVSAFLYRYRRDELGLPEAMVRQEMESIWRPGGVWACLIGDEAGVPLPHRIAGRDY